MTEPRRPRYTKRDANQQEIVDGLRAHGFFVLDLADVGGRTLDLFVCGPDASGVWRWLAVEVKTFAGRLTTKQKRFFEVWLDVPAVVARSVHDVLAWYGYAREQKEIT